MQGGAISVIYDSTLTCNGYISFTNNGNISFTGNGGGALYLSINSYLSILSATRIYWENNHAKLGGAIYVFNANPLNYCTKIAPYIPKDKCFFQLADQNLSSDLDAKLVFINNSAYAAGSALYGGAIDNCKLTGQSLYSSTDVFNKLVQFEDDNTTSEISSDPFQICPCENNYPNCSTLMKKLSIHPGETFQVSVVSTGQRNGTVPAQVRSQISTGRLLGFQYIQQTSKRCTRLSYTVFSLQNAILQLYADGPCSTFGDKLVFKLNINETCPPGFNINQEEKSCVCDHTLQKYTNNCNITNGLGKITRKSDDTFWAGYDQSQKLLIVHPHCPLDYCVSYIVTFSLNSTLSDKQCAYNRSGLLCGACLKGYSLVLGTSHCKKCTNHHVALLIPFALMGVALISLLLACKMTVSTGTLNGLVFYANIVGVNHSLFLPVKGIDVFSLFIAWLNLDFGIETCFYNGMDAYANTWLQFVFPIYLWVLVGLLILISHFSQRFANALGSNPVSVLATLILLSYTKILCTLTTAFYITNIKYSEEHLIRNVWIYDGNIEYLAGKHIPLFLVAVLVLLFLFLPFTLLLLLSQWLQAISHLRLFSWVNSSRLKPFMDSYHAPYKAKHRYWPGLLLVLRFVLLLVFAYNPKQDHSINLLTVVVVTGSLQLWALVSGGVYKNWCLDALEGSSMLNLTILAAATYHVKLSKGNQLVVGYMSVTIALVTFIGILTYHSLQQLRNTKLWKRVTKLNFKFKSFNIKQTLGNLSTPKNNPTGSGNLDQLREPWLEDLLQATHSTF